MKIGIITFWWCHENYGQILQCFALQEVLRKRGHQPFLIKYRAKSHFDTKSVYYIVHRALRSPMSLFLGIKNRLDGTKAAHSIRKEQVTRERDFEAFRRKYITSTEDFYESYREICANIPVADAYLCGSDIVWGNFPYNDDGRIMFLDFGVVSAKRIAYSASFGQDSVSKKFERFVTPLLSKLDGIGVREASGVRICSKMGRSDAVHVLDPTLLLCKNDYLEALKPDSLSTKNDLNNFNSEFVFGYFLSAKTDVPWAEIDAYCKEKNRSFKLTTVYSDYGFPKMTYCNPTIPEWVGMMSRASVVLTNSFHGTAFAVIMQRPFLAFLRAGNEGLNDRILSFLNSLKLESRIYNSQNGSIHQQIEHKIDWCAVEAKLNAMRSQSLSFLTRFGL